MIQQSVDQTTDKPQLVVEFAWILKPRLEQTPVEKVTKSHDPKLMSL